MNTLEARTGRPASMATRLRGLRRLLNRPVRIRRDDGRLQLDWDDADSPERHPHLTHPGWAVDPTRQAQCELNRSMMRAELQDLLDQHATARALYASLVLVERALGSRDLHAFDRLAPEVVRDASTSLIELARGSNGDGLSMLRGRLRQIRAAQCRCIGSTEDGKGVDAAQDRGVAVSSQM
jgi:hypothetical protein